MNQKLYSILSKSEYRRFPGLPVELIVYLKNLILKNYKSNFSQLKKFTLLSDKISPFSVDNLCFAYKNSVFSILIDVRDSKGKSYLDDNKKMQQISHCRKYNIVPCLYPVIIDNPFEVDVLTISLSTSGWNLFHTLTKKNIDPISYSSEDKVMMSKWELCNIATRNICSFLQKNKYKVLSMQSYNDLIPSVLFSDESGKKSWCIIDIDVAGVNCCNRNIDKIVQNNYYNNGFLANFKLCSECFRGADVLLELQSFEKIHSVDSYYEYCVKDILQEDIYNLILSTIVQQSPISDVNNILVYRIPNNQDYLLKIPSYIKNELPSLTGKLYLHKIIYGEHISLNNHFGIPLFSVSKTIEPESLTPDAAISFGKDSKDVLIIRIVSGVELEKFYFDEFEKLFGTDASSSGFKQFANIIRILFEFGTSALEKALDLCAEGAVMIKEGQVAKNSPDFEFYSSRHFYQNYRNFVDSYLIYLKNISELPQKTFDQAIKDILCVKEFVFDFTHPGNTFIDFEKSEFHFIDFIFTKIEMNKKMIEYENIVRAFRDVLLGINFSSQFSYPYQIFAYPKDFALLKKYSKIITNKINKASPDEYFINDDYQEIIP